MHTFEECKIKIKGIETLLKQIQRLTKDNVTAFAVAESAEEMCKELLREDITGKYEQELNCCFNGNNNDGSYSWCRN